MTLSLDARNGKRNYEATIRRFEDLQDQEVDAVTGTKRVLVSKKKRT